MADINRRIIPAGATLSMVPVRDGWPLRLLDWPAEPGQGRGAILFQGGRGDIIEKYLEPFALWHAAGWHVSAFDWRGQGGSGRLSPNPRVGHIDDFATWIDDLADFWSGWCARTSGPRIVMGHSMGGHLVLRALCERRITPDGAVLVAPMLGFDTAPLPASLAARIAHWMARRGDPARAAWKRNEKPTLPGVSRQKLLTHDASRYSDELWWKAQKPELELGPPSWQWMAAAYDSCAGMEAPGVLEAMTTPTLILGTDGDKLVSPGAIRAYASRMPHARLHMFDKSVAHEILREGDRARGEALRRIEQFIGQF